jgi:[protein-PII] uridylyltransferase
LARFGLDAPDIEHVSKLILHHLTMYFVAARRDLADPNTIAQFADQVGDQDCLCSLYLLTIADISTTAPTSMTSWKSRMLDELYAHTNEQLRGDACDPLQRARSAIVAHLAGQVEPARLEAFLRTMPNRYVLSNTPAEISAHITALEGAQGKRVHLQVVPSRHEGVGELCVVTGVVPDDQRVGDRPGLLASIAAALTSNRLEIFAAQIYTRLQEAGREEVLDVFWVRDRLHGTAGLVETLPKVEQNLEQLLSGQVTPQELLQKVAPTRWSDRPSPPVPTEVAVDNRSSDSHTIIEVIAQDRPGVLFGLAHTLHQLGLDIAFAKVNTEGNRVVDIFYVTELDETKVATRERMLQIKSQLSAAMHRNLTHSA